MIFARCQQNDSGQYCPATVGWFSRPARQTLHTVFASKLADLQTELGAGLCLRRLVPSTGIRAAMDRDSADRRSRRIQAMMSAPRQVVQRRIACSGCRCSSGSSLFGQMNQTSASRGETEGNVRPLRRRVSGKNSLSLSASSAVNLPRLFFRLGSSRLNVSTSLAGT